MNLKTKGCSDEPFIAQSNSSDMGQHAIAQYRGLLQYINVSRTCCVHKDRWSETACI